MRENRLRQIWQEGGAALNGWLHLANSYAAEVMANACWDSLTIDMQHGPVGYESAVLMLQAISTTNTVPLARVPWNEPGIIMKMLDAGCYGIICPMVNSRAECETFVGACRYPPMGYRSNGINRVKYYAGSGYFEHSNETIVTMAMIETAVALQNIDDILSVPGLDALYIGPSDLSISLGQTKGVTYTEPPLSDAVETIIASAHQHNIVLGAHTSSAADALYLIGKGFQFVTVGSDARLLTGGSQEIVTAVKGQQSSPKASGPY
jgi:4-hydroxy-2-oxoheptanedioate aldolase